MQSLILFLKGIIIGIGKIIPGVSGSMLAFSLGVYEQAILAIANFFQDFKQHSWYLFKLGSGILIAILLFSNLVIFMLDKFYLYTIILFIGLIAGTIPSIIKKVKVTKKINLIYLLLAILLVYSINAIRPSSFVLNTDNLLDFLLIIGLGFIDALTMIIPGISGTATFMMLGCYDFVLTIFSNPFANLLNTSLFFLGVILGIIIVSYVIFYILSHYPEQLYLLIIGFSLSSLFYLGLKIISFITLTNILPCLILGLVGFLISFKLD